MGKYKLTKSEKAILDLTETLTWKPYIFNEKETMYEVSDLGIVRNKNSKVILNGSPDKRGYIMLTLHIDGKSRSTLLHRIVAKTFIPNPDNKPTVNHKDGNKRNNAVSNLEWATHQENIIHALRTGLRDLRGTRAISNKYSEKQVRDMCELLQKGYSMKDAAELLNVNINLARRILYFGKWAHITKDYTFPKYHFNKDLVTKTNETYANVEHSSTIPKGSTQ